MGNFYNTINEDGDELSKSKKQSLKQEAIIYSIFDDNENRSFTPFEILEIGKFWNTPITSIRRAINTLTKKGFIVKTDEKRKGAYGKANYCWKKWQQKR